MKRITAIILSLAMVFALTSCGGQSGSFFQLLDELPAVECIQKINVSGTSVQYFDRQFPFLHKDA